MRYLIVFMLCVTVASAGVRNPADLSGVEADIAGVTGSVGTVEANLAAASNLAALAVTTNDTRQLDWTNAAVFVAAPTLDPHAATKKYVDDNAGGSETSTLSSVIARGPDAGANNITNLLDPVDSLDAANKQYVDNTVTNTAAWSNVLDTLGDLTQNVCFTMVYTNTNGSGELHTYPGSLNTYITLSNWNNVTVSDNFEYHLTNGTVTPQKTARMWVYASVGFQGDGSDFEFDVYEDENQTKLETIRATGNNDAGSASMGGFLNIVSGKVYTVRVAWLTSNKDLNLVKGQFVIGGGPGGGGSSADWSLNPAISTVVMDNNIVTGGIYYGDAFNLTNFAGESYYDEDLTERSTISTVWSNVHEISWTNHHETQSYQATVDYETASKGPGAPAGPRVMFQTKDGFGNQWTHQVHTQALISTLFVPYTHHGRIGATNDIAYTTALYMAQASGSATWTQYVRQSEIFLHPMKLVSEHDH